MKHSNSELVCFQCSQCRDGKCGAGAVRAASPLIVKAGRLTGEEPQVDNEEGKLWLLHTLYQTQRPSELFFSLLPLLGLGTLFHGGTFP